MNFAFLAVIILDYVISKCDWSTAAEIFWMPISQA